MNIFKRMFRIGQSEVNSGIDKLEDPIKMTEQGIRDLKGDLNKSIEALASVKAMSIRARKEGETYGQKTKDYEKKAMLLLGRAQSGEMDAADAERLAKEALARKRENEGLQTRAAAEQQRLQQNVEKMQVKINNLRSNIGSWENELKTLKSRVKVSEASERLNKQLANVDSSSTVSLLERMREKVDEQEAIAESYGEIAESNSNYSLDEEIDMALIGATSSEDDDLAALKAKMGLGSEEKPKEGAEPDASDKE